MVLPALVMVPVLVAVCVLGTALAASWVVWVGEAWSREEEGQRVAADGLRPNNPTPTPSKMPTLVLFAAAEPAAGECALSSCPCATNSQQTPCPTLPSPTLCSCGTCSWRMCGWLSSRLAWRRRSASSATSPAAVRCPSLQCAALPLPLPSFKPATRPTRLTALSHTKPPTRPPALCALCRHHHADVLAAHPRRRAGIQLWQGLRHLTSLRGLRLERQAGAGMPANALACRGLRGLTLIECEARDWPSAPYTLSEWGGRWCWRVQEVRSCRT